MLEGHFSSANGFDAAWQFLRVFLGGIAVGVASGIFVSELLVRLYHGNQGIPVVLSLVLAYFSFIIAEHELHVSGVMSVLSAAI
ncbi:MAG: cation:proton antiporter [Methyloprofundus sp.]|nr:cation:proton antiporter [Methyloprofundus sp.]